MAKEDVGTPTEFDAEMPTLLDEGIAGQARNDGGDPTQLDGGDPMQLDGGDPTQLDGGMVPPTNIGENPGMWVGANYENDDLIPESLRERYAYSGTIFSRGAEAICFLASEIETKRPVVIKVYRPSRKPNASVLKKLQKMRTADESEYRKHLPEIIGYRANGRDRYEIMEHIEGGVLGEAKYADFKTLVRLLSESVGYLHKNGIIHRDIKPSNLVYDGARNSLKIIDFGLALIENGDDTSGNKEGTPPYQAVEAYDAHMVDRRVDWWAVGIVLLERLIGHVPLADAFGGLEIPAQERQKNIVRECRDFLVGTGATSLEAEVRLVRDDRARRLVLGLLSPYGMRWGADAVARWLNGENIRLVFWGELVGDVAEGGTAYDEGYDGGFSVPGHDRVLATPEDVYSFLANHYPACDVLFTDQASRFRAWARGFSGEGTRALIIAQIDSNEAPEYRAMVIQKILMPGNPLHYRGIEMGAESIVRVLRMAQGGDGAAIDWLARVYEGGILGTVESLLGERGDGPWMQWNAQAARIAREADALAADLAIRAFAEYYMAHMRECLYIAFAAYIGDDDNMVAGIYRDTLRRYDQLEIESLPVNDLVMLRTFMDTYVVNGSIAHLFVANVVLPRLVQFVEERRMDIAVAAEGITQDEDSVFRRRQSDYRLTVQGIQMFGPMDSDSLDERIRRQSFTKHDFFQTHSITDGHQLVPTLDGDRVPLLKAGHAQTKACSVTDAEVEALFGMPLRAKGFRVRPIAIPPEIERPVRPDPPVEPPNHWPIDDPVPPDPTPPTQLGAFARFIEFIRRLFLGGQ